MRVSDLFIYPLKSARGIAFLSQRSTPSDFPATAGRW